MKQLFIDVDGVVRNLDYSVLGEHSSIWAIKVEGLSFVEYVNRHKEKHLVDTPETEYCPALKLWYKLTGPTSFKFLTAQPEEWRPYTSKWLEDRFPGCSIVYVNNPTEKASLLAMSNGLLIEDYPFFKDYKNIVLIDRPYNQKVDCLRIMSVEDFLVTIVATHLENMSLVVTLCYNIAKSKGWWDVERNDGEMIALMHSELSEALEALRSSDDTLEHVGEELVDCCIRIFDYCGGKGINFTEGLAKKIVKNLGRPHKHGKKF